MRKNGSPFWQVAGVEPSTTSFLGRMTMSLKMESGSWWPKEVVRLMWRSCLKMRRSSSATPTWQSGKALSTPEQSSSTVAKRPEIFEKVIQAESCLPAWFAGRSRFLDFINGRRRAGGVCMVTPTQIWGGCLRTAQRQQQNLSCCFCNLHSTLSLDYPSLMWKTHSVSLVGWTELVVVCSLSHAKDLSCLLVP